MADAIPAEPVKLLIAVLLPAGLTGENPRWQHLRTQLEAAWGSIDFQGANHPFDATNYYADEMGPQLARRLVAFERLFAAEEIGAAKHACNQLESSFAFDSGGRTFNLDIGYLDHAKLVLASMKPAGQKIYLGEGVYADPIARYEAGRYQPFPWTFPDFRAGRYDAELSVIRSSYLSQLKAWRAQSR